MNRRLYIILAVLSVLGIALYSCGGSSSSNSYEVTEEWKAFQKAVYDETASDPDYTRLSCMTGNGYIYYKNLTGNEFPPVVPPTGRADIKPKITEDGYPYFNDSVIVRYLGWYHFENTEGEKKTYYFDGTENDEVNDPPLYSYNKQTGAGFRIKSLTSGFASMLQNMKAGDKVQVCIPYNLAYGEYNTYNSAGTLTMPGSTTLFFNIYLMRIYPINPGEFPGADTGEGNH